MTSTNPRAAGGWGRRLILSPGRLLFIGPGGAAEQHAHHATQLVVGLRAEVKLEVDGRRLRRRATMVRSNVPHALEASDNGIALILLDANQTGARQMPDSYHATELRPIIDGLGAPSVEWSSTQLGGWLTEMLARLGAKPRPRVLSGATRRALGYVEGELERVPRLDVAAERAGLSPSRLTHLFRLEVGLPFRRFVLWARLKRAAELAAGGATITECAVAAGFSDGAHFSRTFRGHFGLPPSVVLPLIELDPLGWPTS